MRRGNLQLTAAIVGDFALWSTQWSRKWLELTSWAIKGWKKSIAQLAHKAWTVPCAPRTFNLFLNWLNVVNDCIVFRVGDPQQILMCNVLVHGPKSNVQFDLRCHYSQLQPWNAIKWEWSAVNYVTIATILWNLINSMNWNNIARRKYVSRPTLKSCWSMNVCSIWDSNWSNGTYWICDAWFVVRSS